MCHKENLANIFVSYLGLVIIVTIGLMCLHSNALAAESVLDKIKERGELRVAGVIYRPFIYPKATGEYTGIDVEVMK